MDLFHKLLNTLLIILGISVTAQLTGLYYEADKSQEFLEQGQYQPEYVVYDDYQMNLMCEHYSLAYDFEEAVCVAEVREG